MPTPNIRECVTARRRAKPHSKKHDAASHSGHRTEDRVSQKQHAEREHRDDQQRCPTFCAMLPGHEGVQREHTQRDAERHGVLLKLSGDVPREVRQRAVGVAQMRTRHSDVADEVGSNAHGIGVPVHQQRNGRRHLEVLVRLDAAHEGPRESPAQQCGRCTPQRGRAHKAQ